MPPTDSDDLPADAEAEDAAKPKKQEKLEDWVKNDKNVLTKGNLLDVVGKVYTQEIMLPYIAWVKLGTFCPLWFFFPCL